MDSFWDRVLKIQTELKVPKEQFNKFGGYKFRSCEDILEAVKPFLAKNKIVLTIGDEMVQIGDRYYICATATLRDAESGDSISNSAYAREAADKKGMDDSQITGTTSSYARKYALNGLFCLDDTKDNDTSELHEEMEKKSNLVQSVKKNGTPTKTESTIPICENCGKPIFPVKKKDGTTWNTTDMVKYSSSRFGKPLCGSCMKEEQKNEPA